MTQDLPVLVLRPEPGNTRTCAALTAAGCDVRPLPLFRIAPVAWQPPVSAEYDALLLTSANAVRHGGDALATLRGLPVWCVGQATAAAAQAAGLAIAHVGTRGIADLLAAAHPQTRLLWLCGQDRTEVSPPAHINITPLPVYTAVALPILTNAVATPSIALLHSVRAARRFADLVDDRNAIVLVALSPSVAAAADDGWRSIKVADQPRDAEMVAIASQLCQKN